MMFMFLLETAKDWQNRVYKRKKSPTPASKQGQ
nr:MAG TPA: hypothetical protein [Bacteriophage sp.]